MITLDQIQQLDQKVQRAISYITDLRRENNSLKHKLDEYQKRIEELEILISDFKRDQGEIEKGIISALSQLEKLEYEHTDQGTKAPTESAQPEHDVSTEKEAEETALTAEPSVPDGREYEQENTDAVSEEETEEGEEETEEESGSELDIF